MPPPLCLPARPPSAFIASRHPSAWRETLAALLTGAPYDQFTPLLGVLAGKLAAAGMAHAATLVYVCAGDVDAAVRQWTRAAVKEGQGQAAAAGGPSLLAVVFVFISHIRERTFTVAGAMIQSLCGADFVERAWRHKQPGTVGRAATN